MLGGFSKTELTELGKLGKTTQFYLENLVNLEKTNQFCSVLLGFTQFCLVLLGFTWFYSKKLIGTEFAKLGQLGTKQYLWLSEKTS